ncbi:pyrroline-5-carboxylate reductase [Halovulum dunhuangense]|uniref:Pyrroline-5-carboxylate reductase n=1 Tax=Halovulum dunhuangense TaxID=1505036 RepID=A0A849L597_9RHOB|nr:pyrroline-5-carboxylate reductase [Halovulum dunhuangense]NNU81628.1 pyrroline-5-carboxylate reductase [Halovulum dunhuangense]
MGIFDRIADKGILLLGCGKMGSAMLEGWLSKGLPPQAIHVRDPNPSDRLKALAGQGLHLNADLPAAPAICLVAVKPQMMGAALPDVAALGGGPTLVLSIAAGTPIARFEQVFGAATPIVRAMPNTPAAIGRGITALIGNDAAGPAHLDMAEAVLAAIGETVRLEHEDQIDAVTGLSGSGPAYVFHLIECLAAAGEAEGLAPALAMRLAKATVAGAGMLAMEADEGPAQLRANVTSPNGTTQAGLAVLMDAENGLPPLIRATVAAAAGRSRELKG